jgi:hypothetical protein
MPIPFMLVCAKYDDFANKYDPLKKKQLCLALRYFAHLYGCDLVFASVKERLPFNLFRAMLGRHAFDSGEKVKIEKDPNNALNMYAASDSFLNIGEPEGSGQRGRVSVEQLWTEQVAQHFPPGQTQEKGKSLLIANMSKFPEEKIDAMRR